MAIDQTTASSPMSSDEGSHRHGPIGVILDVAVRFRWAIIVLTVFAAIYGAFNLVRLPIDAVPDITNTQVQINTSAAALSPSQVETQIADIEESSEQCIRDGLLGQQMKLEEVLVGLREHGETLRRRLISQVYPNPEPPAQTLILS